MNRDEYQIRAPFKATYGFHKAKNRPVARYYVYNVDGERKQRMKSFSRQFEYQSPESIAEFDHWFEKMDVFNNPFVGNPEITYSVKEIADRWHDFHAQFFGGNRQDESFHRMVVRLLEDHFNLPANNYRSSMLLALRDQLQQDAEVQQNRNRDWINRHINAVKKLFEWSAARDFVDKSVVASLNTIENLRAKQSPNLRGAEQREAADVNDVEKAIAFANPTIATMLILQAETGMRPKELREMTWDDITKSDADLYVYRPKLHKNLAREKAKRQKSSRVIFFNQRATDALWDYHVKRPAPLSEYIFTPRECKAYNRLRRHTDKYTDEIIEVLQRLTLTPDRRASYRGEAENDDVFTYAMAADLLGVHPKTIQAWKTKRVDEFDLTRAYHLQEEDVEMFDRQLYQRQVAKVCQEHSITVFTPYQVRHTFAEEIDAQFGRQEVAALLGHKRLDTSAIYAKQNHDLAERVQKKRSA